MVVSGVYACQFVLVVKLTAVLNARSGVIAVAPCAAWAVPNPCGLNGSKPWMRWIRYVSSRLTTLNVRREAAYPVQRCS